ncbi:putative ubiquitinyl hydrolase 1 [Helianthus debilis subsp. tardiflorus]
MEGSIVRRVIPSDNSCLFNVVGYVMDHDKNKAPELRHVIAATVASDPTKYSEAFLGNIMKNIVLEYIIVFLRRDV